MNTPSSCQVCANCLMDSTDENIVFDANGICNHCNNYSRLIYVSDYEQVEYERTICKVRQVSAKYNCIVGVSGGLDSTYLLIHAVQDLKLRPLAVHIDNGWNTGLANSNIHKLCSALNTDLHTTVLDWKEFRKMQIAILKAGVPDLEAPTDLFINYTLRNVAKQFGIKYVLAGTNPQTESVMGSSWSYGQRDPIYLKELYRQAWGDYPKKLPFLNWYFAMFRFFLGKVIILRPLKYIPYNQMIAKRRSIDVASWEPYPQKHGESFITRFYQRYFLPTRFGYDKSKAHLSSLILSGDLTREEACRQYELARTQTDTSHADIIYLCTKLEISESQFDDYMSMPLATHADFSSIKDTRLFKIFKKAKQKHILPDSILRLIEKLVLH